jgi:uncharacterized protein (TIGR02996 family)
MVQERALLEAIRAQPEDDVPRLDYAAWLQDRGDVRGEFIKTQVALAQARLARDWTANELHYQREQELLEQHQAAWLAPAGALGLVSPEFRRGMLEHGSITVANFLANSNKLFKVAPLLRSLTFYNGGTDALPSLAAHAPFRRLEEISFASCSIPAAAIDVFAGSRNTAKLRALSLYTSMLTGAASAIAEAIARLPQMRALTRLSLDWMELGDRAIIGLARAPAFSRLRYLSLAKTAITDASLFVIAGSGQLACAEGLYLDNNRITDRAVQALADCPQLACLTALGLAGAQVGDAGIEALVASPYLHSLRSLAVGNRVTNRGVQALAATPLLSTVRELWLAGNWKIGPAGAEALASSKCLANLENLTLEHTSIGSKGALALARSTRLPSLNVLAIYGEDQPSDRKVLAALKKRFDW